MCTSPLLTLCTFYIQDGVDDAVPEEAAAEVESAIDQRLYTHKHTDLRTTHEHNNKLAQLITPQLN